MEMGEIVAMVFQYRWNCNNGHIVCMGIHTG